MSVTRVSQLFAAALVSAVLFAGCSSDSDSAPGSTSTGASSTATGQVPGGTSSGAPTPTESVVAEGGDDGTVGDGTVGQDPTGTAGAPDPSASASVPTADPADDPAAEPVVAGLAEGFLSEVTLQLDADQAACIARGYIRVVGADTFAKADPADPKQMMKALNSIAGDGTYTDGLVDTFVGCGAAIKGAASTALSESTEDLTEAKQIELVECVATQLDDNLATTILRGMLGAEGNVDRTTAGQTLSQLGTGCGFKMRVYP